jgi:hypothetical protein
MNFYGIQVETFKSQADLNEWISKSNKRTFLSNSTQEQEIIQNLIISHDEMIEINLDDSDYECISESLFIKKK